MHTKFLHYFVDPVPKEELLSQGPEPINRAIREGLLISSTEKYLIIRDISRFVLQGNYADNFGWQWDYWSRVQFDSNNIGKFMENHTGRLWQTIWGITDNRSHELEDQLVLEVGCGPGTVVEVARSKGDTVVGIDYSIAADAANKNFANDPTDCIVQADALKLPFQRCTFDAAFSL